MPDNGNYEVFELSPDGEALDNELLLAIYQAFLERKISLPAMPGIAQRVRKAVRDPDMGPNDIARIVQTDPALIARLIQVANSPAYKGAAPIKTATQAVVRMGMPMTRNLVFRWTMRQVFAVQDPRIANRLRRWWNDSGHLGALSTVLGHITPTLNPETAQLAGLLCDIGVLPLLAEAQKHMNLYKTAEDVELVVNHLKAHVGAMLLDTWGLPQEVIITARESEQWLRDPQPHADYCDLVLIARLHHAIATGQGQDLPRMDEVPALKKIAHGNLTPQLSLSILEDAQEEITEIQRTLIG